MKLEEAKVLIEYIKEESYETTEWEDNFIENILKWNGDLTIKQAACLRRIYEKSTGG